MYKYFDEKKSAISPQDYYSSLTKKEKSQLIAYVMTACGMTYTTVRAKLSGDPRSRMTKLEEIAINDIISTDVWRQ